MNQNFIHEDYVEIVLTQDKIALVDLQDWNSIPALQECQWHVCERGKPTTFGERTYTAQTSQYNSNTARTYMHDLIMPPQEGMYVLHLDFNPLNNRRGNLIYGDDSMRSHRKRPMKGKASIYKGVGKHQGKWQARIFVLGVKHLLGEYELEEQAAAAYDEAAKLYFGEHAYQNLH